MVVDIVFVIMALLGFYLGFARGIIQTVFTALSLLLGVMAAFKFAQPMTEFLSTLFSSENPLMFAAGFLLSFVLMMVFIRLLARGLEGLLKTANINIVNKIAGGMLLAGFMILVYSYLVLFGDKAHLIDPQTKAESLTYPYVEKFPEQVGVFAVKLKPTLEQFWDQTMDAMDKLEDMSIERTETDPNVYDLPDAEK